MCILTLPEYFKTKYGTPETLETSSSTIEEALDELTKQHPKLKEFLFTDEKQLRKFINIFIEGNDIRDLQGLSTHVEKDHEIVILLAVAGG